MSRYACNRLHASCRYQKGCVKNRNTIDRDDLAFLKEKTKFNEQSIERFYTGFVQNSVDGKMSKEEFSQMFQEIFCTGQNLEELSACIFKALDTDQNGYVDFRELVLGLSITFAGSKEDRLRWFFTLQAL